MGAYIVQRLGQGIIVLLIVSIIVFLTTRLFPGDPTATFLGEEATPELVAAVKARLGLDKPLPMQYLIWISHVLRGDLGESYYTALPVANLVAQKIVPTVQLALYGLIISILIGIPAGVISAVNQYSILDHVVTALALIGVSLPVFWLGIMLILLFSIILRWLPTSGYAELSNIQMHLKYAIMPAFSLGVVLAAPVMRLVRSSMLEVLSLDYIQTARSKGLSERVVIFRHALRNCLIPVITIVGLQFGSLMGGTVVIESVFSWPGIGWLTLQAVYQRDYPVLQATVLLIASAFVVVNLLVDLAYTFIDPRVRLQGSGES